MSHYAETIVSILYALNRKDVDERHVEAYIRLEHGTLDALSMGDLVRETKIALDCLDADGCDLADDLAASFGLMGKAPESGTHQAARV